MADHTASKPPGTLNMVSVIVTKDGAFVPQSVFGEGATISHHVQRRPDGTVEVKLLGHPLGRGSAVVVDGAAEQLWIENHRAEYAGQWVSLDHNRLLAHGPDPRQVYLAARATGGEVPSLVKVPAGPELPFGGW